MLAEPKDIIKKIDEAIEKNSHRLLHIADTEEEQQFLAKQGKKLEQIREAYGNTYGIIKKEGQKKIKQEEHK
jgi:hypothetical protein